MSRSMTVLLLHLSVALPVNALSEFDLRLEAHEWAREPARGSKSASTTVNTYKYDDDGFETSVTLRTASGETAYENELAQRFTLSSPGVLSWAEVCLGNGGAIEKSFEFDVYVRRDSGGLPGFILDRATSNSGALPSRTYNCYRVTGLDAEVGTGAIWVSVEWRPDSDIALMVDDSNSRGRRAFRGRNSGGPYSDWQAASGDHVYGIRLGVQTASPPPPPDDPDDPPGEPSLHDGQFQLAFVATASNRNHDGQVAAWPSSKGILFWVFDAENPEALVKVLDGRSINTHWWMDVAVTSDLKTATRARHRGTGAAWTVQTGRAKEFGITDPDIADELVHCAAPLDRADQQCAIVGFGTTVSLRDGWTADGWIPYKYYSDTSQATSAATFGLFRAQRPRGPVDKPPTMRTDP